MRHQRTILVADDDDHVRKAVRLRLRAGGFNVVEAESGLETLREYRAQPLDAILLDFDMPGGDGKTVARTIRAQSDVPIVFISGYPREQFRKIVHQLPDVYFLAKPLDASRLAELLESVCVA
jgi:two-component system, OmpR family, response regulator